MTSDHDFDGPAFDDIKHMLNKEFRDIVHMQYHTDIDPMEIETKLAHKIAQAITFRDFWQIGQGRDSYLMGLKGFHTMLKLRFKIIQSNIQLRNISNDIKLHRYKKEHEEMKMAKCAGRFMADGIMYLHLLEKIGIVYPLRTILVYDFLITRLSPEDREVDYVITHHEEMWSLSDMIEAIPGIGRIYDGFRRLFCFGFLTASFFSYGFKILFNE